MYQLQWNNMKWKIMTRNQLCWSVAAVQVGLAMFLWWYAPLQTAAAEKAARAKYPNQRIGLSLEFYQRIEPAPSQRVSFALNFPALILSVPFQGLFPRPLYESKQRLLLATDVVFFAWTGLLWYWITSEVIGRKPADDLRAASKPLRTICRVCGLVFALLLGATAITLFLSALSTAPNRQIAPFGLLWALGLALYFGRKLWSQLKPAQPGQP
jgi:hypothetical protein